MNRGCSRLSRGLTEEDKFKTPSRSEKKQIIVKNKENIDQQSNSTLKYDSDQSEESNESDSDFLEYDESEVGSEELLDVGNQLGHIQWKEIKKVKESTWLKEYNVLSGPQNHQLTPNSAPLAFFNLLFSEELIESLRIWTNAKASNKIDNRKRRTSKMKVWKNMEKESCEIHAFLGCLMAMGICKLPSIREYWQVESRLFSVMGIKDLFSRTRFIDIYSNLCLRDPQTSSDTDKMAKITPFVESIIFGSQFYYLPKRELSIDESIIPFSGRHSLVQFVPSKPVKYGFKAFLLCEAESGYVLNWKMYTGDPRDENHGATYKTVMSLCDGVEGEGSKLFMDRYYTGIQLITDLKDIQIGACGTIMMNRAQIDDKLKKKLLALKDRETLYLKSQNELLLTCWKDAKLVMVISNFHGTEVIETQRRMRKKDVKKLNLIENNNKDKSPNKTNEKSIISERKSTTKKRVTNTSKKQTNNRKQISNTKLNTKKENNNTQKDVSFKSYIKENVMIPASIAEYTQHMGGVDLFDQKASYYSIQLRSHRWYMKILFHFIEIAIINSYIIYQNVCKLANKSFMNHLLYRKAIIRDLVKPMRESLGISITKKKSNNKRKSESSFVADGIIDDCRLEEIPSSSGRKTTRYSCQMHSDEDSEVRVPQTRYWCGRCKIPVCILKCYDKHRQNFKQKKVKLT